LPSGRLHPHDALFFGLLLGVFGLGLLVIGTNALTGALGALALVLYVLVYTPMKQSSVFALLVGAVPGAMPALLGFTAATGRLSAGALALFLLLYAWQIPHFLAISLAYREEYRAAGVKVLPNTASPRVTRAAIACGLVLQWLASLSAPLRELGGPLYVTGAVVLGGVLFAFGVVGGRRADDELWPRHLFVGTILYLPLLLTLLLVG
jgi:protoheme IX farnesyltransferase